MICGSPSKRDKAKTPLNWPKSYGISFILISAANFLNIKQVRNVLYIGLNGPLAQRLEQRTCATFKNCQTRVGIEEILY